MISAFPGELFSLGPLIQQPTCATRNVQQRTLLVQDPLISVSHVRHYMLDKRYLDRSYDRFLLTDLNIIMWHSLMPSSPSDQRGARLDPLGLEWKPGYVPNPSFRAITPPEQRYGLDKAAIGSLLAKSIVSKDLRMVAIVWPRFERGQMGIATVKTYMWHMLEIEGGLFLYHVDWAEADDSADPRRVDLTRSRTFAGSRNAIAFTPDNQYIWTAGGRYDVAAGKSLDPPAFFQDPELTQLSFSRHATSIAGIRNHSELEMYDLADNHASFRVLAPGI